MATDPNSQYVSNQDVVSPDVDDLYSKVIKDIDSFRSRCNGIELQLPLKSYDEVIGDSSISSDYQESRTHAFYRMIGFPIVSADGNKMYNPGFDPDLNRDDDRVKNNLDIANSLLADIDLKSILNDRENYSNNSINPFQLKDDAATALTIASIFPRPFDKQLTPGLDPLEIDPQVFKIPARESISLYFADPPTYSTYSVHILKPFITDPRIELSVIPIGNRICAPFLTDKSRTQVAPNNYLRRPYIERVMRTRFNTQNVLLQSGDQPEINQFIRDLTQFVQDNTEISDRNLVEITGDVLQNLHKSELIVFSKFLKIIEALIIELTQDIVDIEKIQSLINWKPICDIRGPEFGAVFNDVDESDNTNNKKIENDIIEQQTKKFLAETDYDLGVSTTDLGNFSFSNIDDIVFGSIKNTSQFYDNQLDKLGNRRNELGNKANQLLRRIEIITGEFSGLGLLDIMAIQAAFWIISPEALAGFLDEQALGRIQLAGSNLGQGFLLPGSRLPINEALKEFEKKLSEIYILIQAFYADTLAGDYKNKQ